MENFRVVFDGFKTEADAIKFANWYEGAGEQDAGDWLEEDTTISAANVDMNELRTMGGFHSNSTGEVIVPLRIYYKEEE